MHKIFRLLGEEKTVVTAFLFYIKVQQFPGQS